MGFQLRVLSLNCLDWLNLERVRFRSFRAVRPDCSLVFAGLHDKDGATVGISSFELANLGSPSVNLGGHILDVSGGRGGQYVFGAQLLLAHAEQGATQPNAAADVPFDVPIDVISLVAFHRPTLDMLSNA